MDNAVEDGDGDGGLSDQFVPVGDRKRCGDEGRAAVLSLFADFQEIETLPIGQAMGSPVVEDKELDPGKPVDLPRQTAVETGHARSWKSRGIRT